MEVMLPASSLGAPPPPLVQLGKSCTVEQRLLANEAFSVLSKAWDAFRTEHHL